MPVFVSGLGLVPLQSGQDSSSNAPPKAGLIVTSPIAIRMITMNACLNTRFVVFF